MNDFIIIRFSNFPLSYSLQFHMSNQQLRIYGRTMNKLYERVPHWRRSTHISYTIRQFYVKSKEVGEVCRKYYTYMCRHSHFHLLLLKWFYALKCYLFIPQAAEIKFLQKLFFFYCRVWKQTREWWREIKIWRTKWKSFAFPMFLKKKIEDS